jgi:hypothetical protein
VYKNSFFAAQCRRSHLLRRLKPLDAQLVRLYSIRKGRIWAGAIGVFGFFALIAEIFSGAVYSSYLLIANWGAMALAFLMARLVATWYLRYKFKKILLPSDDVFLDLARIEGQELQTFALRKVHQLEMRSLVFPIASLTLMMPFTIHFLVGTLFLCIPFSVFNAWFLISLLLVGHAHLTLLILSVMHVVRIRNELDRGAVVGGIAQGFWALLWTVTASTVPGAVLLCIPPVVVALTGLLFIPWMFHWAAKRAQQERFLLEDHGLTYLASDSSEER